MSATETSLRVVVRARPMNTRETKEGARRCVEFYENTGQLVINDSATFAYDSVFPDTVDQETVYEKTALPLLDRIFSGFNATILAYGQTGSGKTYTMGTEDNDGTDEMRRGIIPRLVNALFQRIMATQTPEAFTVTVSMFEVYGDNVYDLLRPDKVKLNVHGDEKNCTIVNLTAVPVLDLKGALKQLATGCHYRTKAETAMNAMSSRSHAVFTVYVEKTATPESDSAFSAKLQLVDLAGSERLKKTEAEGNRMKEGININAGLLILSQVIAALATKQKHIPYRNSVITRVLQDSLGGNSFTVFLACISPADTNSQETLNTLRYADRAKQIKNKPIINKNPKAEEIAILHALIKRLQQENSDLKQGIAPSDGKIGDVASSTEIMVLKDEVARQTEELRERRMKQSEFIVRMNHLAQRNARLEAEKEKLKNMVADVRTTLLNEEMMDSVEIVRSIQQVVGNSEDSTTIQEEDQDETTTVGPAADDTMYDAERLPELQAEIDDLDKQIAMKDENRQKAIDEQREFIEAIKQRESEKTQLVVRCGELETEINKLRQECKKATTASKLAEERRQKLKELERQHAEDKKTLSELKKLQETRRKMEDTLKKTEDELKNLKTQRLRLLREQRAEASKFQAFKQKHEREMAQIKSKLQKREMDVVRQKRVDDQKLAVLQQRLAESNRANKTLRELNLKRANRKGSTTDATAIQSLIEDELELEITAQRCQLLCAELRRQRQDVMKRINEMESKKFEGSKKVCRRYAKARRQCGRLDESMHFDETFTKFCDHSECEENADDCQSMTDTMECDDFRQTCQIFQRRMSNVDPDVSIVLAGEEEFEENRQKELASLRASLDTINEEIKDSLRNETISGSEERSASRWEKVPIEMRPVFENIYSHAVNHIRKELDLEFKLVKTENEFTAKIATKASQEEKRKREEEEAKSKVRELQSSLEAAKADSHEKIKLLLGLVMSGQVDEKVIQQFESLKNQYCDIEQKVKKLARRRTTHNNGVPLTGLTPKPELKRNERSRRAVDHYGKVVNSEDVTMDDSRHFRSRRAGSTAAELNRTTDENVRRKVAMSPIKFDDDTRLSGVEEDMENMDDGSLNNGTFVKSIAQTSVIQLEADSSTMGESNKTFVISSDVSQDAVSSDDIPPIRRKHRRTGLGPAL
ncbi:Protein CBR-KLP-19 [Caenorhabditis briggsae]|uniref:Protein CBR-KLP-19 n=1 Tax=Caenorhabditis briggsae TaxID=6238 RepID=A8WRC8_CAEBR|nr:Protein CBR-KLP-19 [Caenorhabditis briggsae]CAP23036.2 Protein CBR-KLP-19 [Caenorhabditis briggsae]